MGMIRNDAQGPTPEQAAALQEAAERGSLSHPERLQAEIAAFQERLPGRAPAPTVSVPRSEEQFQKALAAIIRIADETSNRHMERLARATESALSLLATRK
jgi:hypothetical protein